MASAKPAKPEAGQDMAIHRSVRRNWTVSTNAAIAPTLFGCITRSLSQDRARLLTLGQAAVSTARPGKAICRLRDSNQDCQFIGREFHHNRELHSVTIKEHTHALEFVGR